VLFIIVIVLLIFLLGGGSWATSRYGYRGGLGVAGLVVVILLLLYFCGGLRAP